MSTSQLYELSKDQQSVSLYINIFTATKSVCSTYSHC